MNIDLIFRPWLLRKRAEILYHKLLLLLAKLINTTEKSWCIRGLLITNARDIKTRDFERFILLRQMILIHARICQIVWQSGICS